MPDDDTFWFHEDDWGQLELEPRENLGDRQRMMAQSNAFSDAHRAPGGIGWTDVYVIPEAAQSLAIRGITVDALAAVLGASWHRVARVTTGYSSAVWDCPNAFAFRPPTRKRWGTLYGSHDQAGVITDLMFTHVTRAESDVLRVLGRHLALILVDMRQGEVIDLGDEAAIARYIELTDDDGDGDGDGDGD
jgi:hypothetical protein